MVRHKGFLTLSLFLASLSFAQSNCPEGFKYVDTLSGTGSASEDFDKRVTLRFPPNAILDESYQQKNVRSTNARHGVRSTMRPQDIPRGVLIIPYGKSDNIYEQAWAVSDPQLKGVERDANGRVTQYEFGMKLFCKVGNTSGELQYGECSVNVDVCYKPLRP